MIKTKIELTKRQFEAMDYLYDSNTTEILYGGSAGGGKTFLGCAWIIINAFNYPGTRWVIARSRLNILKITTIKTFQDIIRKWGLEEHVDYHIFNNSITFKNGSEVLLLDLFLYPQDPDFNRLGSLEITGALIDEAAEITERAYIILTSRIRYKLNEYKLKPKILIVSNPTRNWLYNNFYKPNKDNEMPEWRKFVKALPLDNPYLPEEYIETLKRLPTLDRKRLYEGIWEFDKSDDDLFNVDNLYQIFYNKDVDKTNKYITCDVASSGRDRTIITLWEGLYCKSILSLKHVDTGDIIREIKLLMEKNRVDIKNVLVDAIGVGLGVSDGLKGSVKFMASNKALNNEPFLNIRSQLYFKLSEYINNDKIGISYDGQYDNIIDELITHKRVNADRDTKYQITAKEVVKMSIGRSPDIADALSMRMFWEIKKERIKTYVL